MLRGTYSMWPVLLWAALRFRQRGIAAALLLLAVIVVSGTAAGHGVFGSETMHERLFRAQCYMGITAVSLLTLAAALAERRQAIRARDEFISIASHELKTPLTALKLRLSTAQRLATRAQETPERRERLDHTLATAGTITHRLTRLVDELLEVSRLTSRRLVLHLEPVAAGAMLREVVGRLREQVAEGGSAIMLELSPAVEAMIGLWDRVRVEQVLTNLLSNAVKYGQGKDIAVSARTEGNRIRVAVVDAGMGIAEADQVRIFQAFERVESTHAVGGLGLGLYIGRRIAEGHGGTLSVVSAPGKGSTFVLELPQAASPPREAADQPR
jgi:signal transduction histidine kinase